MTYEELKSIEIPLGTAKNIVGDKYGKLTPLFRVSGDTERVSWACRCDCGNYVIAQTKLLRNGHMTQCGKHKGKDITNMRFGNLIALYKTGEKDNNNYIWHCQCDCGDTIDASTSNLLNGTTTHCKNHNHNIMIGKTFGELTVLSFKGMINGKSFYTCKCSCGKEKDIMGINLKRGMSTTCGHSHHKYHDLTNQKFGKLTAKQINYEKYTPGKSLSWICECECGNIKTFSSNSLVSNQVISCGCVTQPIGEYNIEQILINNQQLYTSHKWFDNCRFPNTNRVALFDFYIENEKPFLLEFDGSQHIDKYIEHWGVEKYVDTHNHDLFKNQWAWDNNIPLKRIPYKYRDSLTIDRIMSDEFIITPITHPEWYPPINSSYPYFEIET